MEKSNKSKYIVIGIAGLIIIAAIVVMLFSGKSVVYSENYAGEKLSIVVKNNNMQMIIGYVEGNAEELVTYNGTIRKNGNYGKVKFQTANICTKVFNLVEEDKTENLGFSVATLGFYMNDKVIYNPLTDSFLLLENFKPNDNDNLGTFSFYKMTSMTNVDLFILKNSTAQEVKEIIENNIKVIKGSLVQASLIMNDQIVSMKVGDADFSTATTGVFDVKVTYDTDKTYTLKVQVGEEKDNVLSQYLTTDLSAPNYLAKGTTLADFITNKEVKTEYDADYTAVTEAMITGFDTSTVGKKDVKITFKNIEKTFKIEVYDPENIKTTEIRTTDESSIIAKGTDLTFKLSVDKDNGQTLILNSTTTGVSVSGFDKNVAGAQLVTVKYDGFEDKFVVYVYDENNNPVKTITKIQNTVTITNGALVGTPCFKLQYMDTTVSDPINITLDMFENLDLTKKISKDYYFSYTVNGIEFWEEIEVNFVD